MNKEKISHFLKEEFLNGKELYYKNVPPKLVMTLVDKVFPFDEKVNFYRRMINNAQINMEERRYFYSRLSKNYLEQAKYYREKEDSAKASEYQNKANEIIRGFSIKEKELEMSTSLTLSDLKSEESPRSSELRRLNRTLSSSGKPLKDKFIVRYSGKHNKVRIENNEDFQICSINLNYKKPEKALRGEVDGELINVIDDKKIIWHFPAWNVKITLEKKEKLAYLTIEDMQGEKITKKFEIVK